LRQSWIRRWKGGARLWADPPNAPPKEELETLYATLTGNELATRYGKSLDVIREWLSYYEIKKVPQRRAKRWGERQAKPTPEQQFVITERREPTPPQVRSDFIPVKQGDNYVELQGKGLTLPAEQQQKIRRLLYLYRLQRQRYRLGLLP